MRAAACASSPGFIEGSNRTAVVAAVSVSPAAPPAVLITTCSEMVAYVCVVLKRGRGIGGMARLAELQCPGTWQRGLRAGRAGPVSAVALAGGWYARVVGLTVSTAQSGSCRNACSAASRCAGLAPARLACRTPLAASASPTNFSRRPQEEKTTW